MTALIWAVYMGLLTACVIALNVLFGPASGIVTKAIMLFIYCFLGTGLLIAALILRTAEVSQSRGGSASWF